MLRLTEKTGHVTLKVDVDTDKIVSYDINYEMKDGELVSLIYDTNGFIEKATLNTIVMN